MMDPRLDPYAQWLEGLLEALVQHKPKKIGMIMLLDEGRHLVGYYGDVYPVEKTMMAHRMQSDALIDEVFANAANIVREAEKQNQEEE